MRVLFLTHRLPYPPDRGDRIRAFHVLRTLADAGMEVDLVSLVHEEQEEAQAAALNGIASRIETVRVPALRNRLSGALRLAGPVPLTHMLLDSPRLGDVLARMVASHAPDVVLAFCSGMARLALEPPLDRFPLVLDLVDVDSEKWALFARRTAGPLRWIYAREARCLGRFEERAAARAHATLVVNERERASLAALVPDADIRIVSVGIDHEGLRPSVLPVDGARVIFCGVFDYRPNERGALWFARDVWPLVRARRADAALTLVGARPTAAVRRLRAADGSIEVTGTVPDVRPYLWKSAVSIAPLAEARGLQTKVLEALAAGLPTVVTSAVAAGLPAAVLPGCQVADDAEPFAEAVIRLLETAPAARRAIAERADVAQHGWRRQLADLPRMLEAAALSGARSDASLECGIPV
jgi:sugar transferase (PEP-CTERM/EpsH1 system associated)